MRPNFFIVGAAKSGTTSLANYLDQHPDVFLCKPKEPNFFAFTPGVPPRCMGPGDSSQRYHALLQYSTTDRADYEALFENSGSAAAVGEASVRYLYYSDSARRIADYAPKAKIIVLLRHPVDRMYSHFNMNLRSNLEPMSFSEALAAEKERIEKGWDYDWHYRRVSSYAHQLARYYDCFPRENIFVLFYDEFQGDSHAALSALFRFLKVDCRFQSDMAKRGMEGSVPKLRGLQSFIRNDGLAKRWIRSVLPHSVTRTFADRLQRANRTKPPRLDPSIRNRLCRAFGEDAAQLRAMLGRTVPWE